MRDTLNNLPFLAYHVETLQDGRKVCITKPGGKQFFGTVQPNDFMVWIYDESQHDRWRISHAEIKDDVTKKLAADTTLGSAFVDKLLEVCNGAEPSEIFADARMIDLSQLPGLPADLILKAYKWIWVQEDCNYPTGDGRWLSMNDILDLRKEMTSHR
jgi:hypothetical protein